MADTTNLGGAIKLLGINQPTWTKHPEYREFLEKQDGVVFEARKSTIPVKAVEALRKEYSIQPVQKRERKTKTATANINLDGASVQELLALREEAEGTVEAMKGDLANAQAELRAVNKQIKQAQADADRRIADAEAAVEQARAEREALLNLTTGADED